MRRLGRVVFVVLGLAVAACSSDDVAEPVDVGTPIEATAPATPTTEDGPAVTPRDPAGVYLSGPIPIPAGPPGGISVVVVGPPINSDSTSVVAVIIRNNTTHDQYEATTEITARMQSGELIGTGRSRETEPSVIGPGEWAYTYALFTTQVPDDAVIQAVGQAAPDSGLAYTQLEVVEATAAPGAQGGIDVTGVVRNTSDHAVESVSGLLMCFDPEGFPLSPHPALLATTGMAPGGIATFTVSTGDAPCPVWALAYSGVP